ncbi:MICOS complex subunit mic25a-like isoform X2 [Phycodurus eques]|uniref:MICOS complex subunit mic25a-like isoform X2 n=1 Tax=Phycodurus eques TaxID=693459 RepID=UPI002ACD381E|nr:MICOS complex subunit mic25a-like isoform X2 [Phycodurus eques]XP_061528610.1 MICOS complex subunit mic25a-like isoform X2 [Phycodurus eques]
MDETCRTHQGTRLQPSQEIMPDGWMASSRSHLGKLSEDVLQRMRGVANIPPQRTQRDTGASLRASSSSQPQQNPQHRGQSSTQSNTNKTTAQVKKEQQKTDRQHSILREELDQKREAEKGKEEMIKAMSRDRQQTRQEAEKAKQLSQELQKKELRLKALDAFYKEQVALLEKRNLEMYEQSKEKFHRAAANTESNVRSRSTDAVCPDLQAQILSCYKMNGQQTLRCSELAKEYMQCINAAKRFFL